MPETCQTIFRSSFGNRLGVLCSLFLISFQPAAASFIIQDWIHKPYMQWSLEDVDEILNDSPWVDLSLKGGARRADATFLNITSHRIRLLSARPVQEAFLRMVCFQPDFEKSVSIESMRKKSITDLHKARLARFKKAKPDDIRLKGSDEHIVISITETSYVSFKIQENQHPKNRVKLTPGWQENPHPDEFMGCELADLAKNTFLSTKTGKKVVIMRYEPPGLDGLGAKLYFPRRLPDGRALATSSDQELRFETEVDGHKITAKFDIKKLTYKGKIEI